MKDKDLNKIAKIEQAISKKYGKDAIQNPKANWTELKEKQYKVDVKKFYDRTLTNLKKEYKARLQDECCAICGKDYFFFKLLDESSFTKWSACYNCFIEKIQGREAEWAKKIAKDKESVFEN